MKISIPTNSHCVKPIKQLTKSIMAISLRRSRRATKKGVSDYNVGDIVEVSDLGSDRSIDIDLDFLLFRYAVEINLDAITVAKICNSLLE